MLGHKSSFKWYSFVLFFYLITLIIPFLIVGQLIISFNGFVINNIFLIILFVYLLIILLNLIYSFETRIFFDFIRKIDFEGIYDLNKLNYKTVFWKLHVLMYVNCLLFSNLLMIPSSLVNTILNKILNLNIGKSCIIGGKIYDPLLIEFGNNVIIGGETFIVSHLIENNILTLKKIKMKNNITIGTKSVVFPGVEIENNVIVGAMALVKKNQILKENSLYVGVPVKFKKSLKK